MEVEREVQARVPWSFLCLHLPLMMDRPESGQMAAGGAGSDGRKDHPEPPGCWDAGVFTEQSPVHEPCRLPRHTDELGSLELGSPA